MGDDNLNQVTNQTPAQPTASWSPETNQNIPASTVPPTVPTTPVSEPTPAPVAVKPPIMSDPDNDKEVVFRPETAASQTESPAPVAPPQESLPPVQTETVVQPPAEPTATPSEGLTLPELTARFYQAKDKSEGESAETTAALSSAVGPLNSEKQTITAPPANLHESGHFTSLPGTGEIDTSAEEEFFQNNITAKPAETPQNQTSEIPEAPAQPQSTAPAPAPASAPVLPSKSGLGQKILLFFVFLFLLIGLGVLGYVGWTWWQQ